MSRVGRWLSTPFRAVRSLFPFTQEGRQTLVYLIFAGAGPALTMLAKWAMGQSISHGQFPIFGSIANKVADALLIIVIALACFVAIRAIKVGPGTIDVQGRDEQDDTAPRATVTTTTVASVGTAAPQPGKGGDDGSAGS